ncbi:lipopolysaccharide biosynthesis protein [Companilactobacillus farciminis]|uniref:lipopolysaccharide biosynthesis protein n=1 Tax=Companilactobacillus farciminis TaxID=1612 RepID=UPI00232FC82F|nr:oligosaccharide flippase family protein [Companilactobacillus farciminis]WCG36002.1 oligosaccharide flippase family protein [Companilactobacillus farciminis]
MMSQRKVGAALSYLNIIAKNLVTFLYTPFLLRFVGQANYGLFQMTNSVMVSLSLLSMGFSSAYVKFYITYKVEENYKQLRKLNALYLILFGCISVIALIIGTILVLNTGAIFGRSLTASEIQLTKYLMAIMVLDVAITFISSVFDSNITVNEQFIFQQSRQLMQTFLVPMICIPLVFMGVGVLSIEITQISVTTLFLILNINYCIRKLNMHFDFTNIDFSLLKDLGIFSFFIFLNQIVDLVNNNVPNFILGMFQGAKMVATFAIAVQVKNMFFMLSTSLSNVFVPRVNKLVNLEKGTDVLTDLMIKVGRIQMALLFFVLGGFIVVGKFFVQLWAGNENIEAYYLVIIMVLPSIIPLCQNVGIEIQRAMNKHIFRSIVYVIFAVVNIVITIVGSIYFGLIGASMGYVVTILCANGISMNWYYSKKMGLEIKRYWGETSKMLVPFVISTIPLILIQNNVSVNSISRFIVFGLIYSCIYIAIYLKFIMNDAEKRILMGFIKR